MRGTLVLVVGRPGAGKTSVVEGARRRLEADERFRFPLRIISRPGGGEDETLHRTVTPAQYDSLRRDDQFALCWDRDGVNFALPRDIKTDLAAGRIVVAEAAPSVIPAARARYPSVAVIEVDASRAVRMLRLAKRDIAPNRLEPEPPVADEDIVRIENDGLPERAVEALTTALRNLADRTPHAASPRPPNAADARLG